MKVLVPIKRVIDAYVKVRVKADKTGIEDNKMSINPFDDIAVEEAVRLKEKGLVTEIVAVTVGPQSSQETLRHALALGADSAIHVVSDDSFDALNIAKILAAIVEKASPQLVIMGKQSIDNDNNQTGQMLAGLLDWPQHTFASEVAVTVNSITVTREIDGGLETLASALPAVVTTDLRLNEPRYATLPNIMKAKRKPIEAKSVSDFNVSLTEHAQVLSYDTPAVREAGEMLDSIDDLVAALKDKEKVIGGGA